jgi:endonuclease/exonuclease/phosphatase family metal-dependent hydrolase
MRRTTVAGLAAVVLSSLLAACSPRTAFVPGPAHLVWGESPAAPTARTAPDSLVVITYNIRYGEALEAALADLWALAPGGADVVLLQEMDPDGAAWLAERLGCGFVYAPASVHPHHDRLFGNAVLSRWPIVARAMVTLPHGSPLYGLRRVAVAADLDVAGRPVRAISVHLASAFLPQAQRLDQLNAALDSLVVGWDGAVILGGDLNTSTPDDRFRFHRRLRAAGLRTVPAAEPTAHWGPMRLWGLGAVLDHVYVRGLSPGRPTVGREATASDHFPLRFAVRWPSD